MGMCPTQTSTGGLQQWKDHWTQTVDLGSTIILAAELYRELSFLTSKTWESREMIYIAPSGAKMYTVLGRLKENCLTQMIRVTSDVFSEDAAKGLKICLIIWKE